MVKPKGKGKGRSGPQAQSRSQQSLRKNEGHASTNLPLELQQLLLNIFKNSFPTITDDRSLHLTLQEIKQHLFNRDFQKAFGEDRLLEAYAFRWSPSRALGYLDILTTLTKHLIEDNRVDKFLAHDLDNPGSFGERDRLFRVTCLGGGAGAEVVALAGYFKSLALTSTVKVPDDGEEPQVESVPRITITVVDIANWESVLQKLQDAVINPPPLSKYASSAAKISNQALLHSHQYEINFLLKDLLQLETPELSRLVTGASLITLMFTLNELYSTSMSKTTRLLLDITATVETGTLLLVVDSPGSYSTVSIGQNMNSSGNKSEETKRYPMQWLLDRTILQKSTSQDIKKDSNPSWEKLESDDSKWFRIPEGLKYPIDLENMRYQIHLYRRI